MKVPKLRVWHLTAIVAASAGFLAVFQYRQSVYDPTSARLRSVRYGGAADRAAAIQELREAEASGPAVIETLMIALRDKDPAVRALAARATAEAVFRGAQVKERPNSYAEPGKAALVEALGDPDASVRVKAATGLSLLEVKSEEAFAILLRAARMPVAAPQTIGDADDHFSALFNLAYSYRDKPETLPTIFAAMTDHDASVRSQGLIALNWYLRESPPVTEPIMQALLARLDDEDDSIRSKAGLALSKIGPSAAPRAVPLMIRNLDQSRSRFRAQTIEGLERFGLGAADARPALRALVESESDLQKQAQEALEKIEKACQLFEDETLPELIAELGNADPAIRASAAQELAENGPRAQPAVSMLSKLLGDPDRGVRKAAADALEAVGATGGASGQARRE